MIDYTAEVEQVLDGPPGKLAFRALCAALTRAGSPQDLLSLCDERLSAWPDELREAPWSWLAALEAGHTKPAWRLVRSLALKSEHDGTVDLVLPDPRSQNEVRGVTHLDFGWFAREQLEILAETLDSWDNLRVLETGGLTEMDGDLVARLAGHAAIARLESLNLVTVREDLWHFQKPPFRPGRPLRLRHAGLRAPDLIHLMRSSLVPELRSADVLVASLEEARELAACTELAQLDRVAIGFRCGRNGIQPMWKPYFGNVIDEDDIACEAFFADVDLASLRNLTVRGTAMGLGREGLGARGVDAIVASGVLRQLTELTLHLLPIDDAAVARVVEGVDKERIEKLTLTNLVVTDVTAEAFVAAQAFPRLRQLDLSENHLGAKGARQLATEVQMPALEYLDLSGLESGSPYYGRPNVQPIGDSGAEAWASSQNATNLTYLNVSATGLGVDGLTALMSSERLRNLTILNLADNPVGAWPAALANAPVWRTLASLDLAECDLDDDDIEALASTTSAPGLRSISLAYNSVGSRGVRALGSWAVVPQLWQLNLHENLIGDDGLIELAAAERLLELDVEQDVWNATAGRHGTQLPAEAFDQNVFPSLDAIFLGIVDEYHSARSSGGFPAQVRQEIASASTTRPALVAFLTHLDMDGEPDEPPSPEWESQRADHDFRPKRAANHATYVDEAQDFARRMIEGDIRWPPERP